MAIDTVRRRKEMRLEQYDYSLPGVYFLTFCVKNHRLLFGTVTDGAVHLSAAGKMVKDTWEGMTRHYRYVALDDFVVMPNHFHGLLVINGDPGLQPTIPEKIQPLGQLVAEFKSLTTKRINKARETPGQPLWQRNYWDRVIRNEKELNRIREYILTNPSRWEVDRLNPDARIRMNESVTNRRDIDWMV